MNKIIISGHSARDVELETSENGKQFARINLAVSRKFDKDATDWFNCVVFGALAEKVASVYIKKGTRVLITGRLEFSEQEKDGVKVRYPSVLVEDIELLGGKNNNENININTNAELKPIDDSDLPF